MSIDPQQVEPRMSYASSRPITRELAEQTLGSGDSNEITETFERLVKFEDDWRWVQDQLLKFTSHSDKYVRGAAVAHLAWLARSRDVIDLDVVWPVMDRLRHDNEIASYVANAIRELSLISDKRQLKRHGWIYSRSTRHWEPPRI